ncbi:MAG: cytochrome C [Bacteroidetes bacterium]|nr:cytochrome C [Bacteroidota bacterium]
MKLPETLNNRLSFIGSILAVISVLMIVFFSLLSLLYEQSSNYLGLFTFIILPVFLIIGLILIPIGMLAKRRKLKDPNRVSDQNIWIINFSDKRHRNAAIVFTIRTVLFLFLSGIGSYEAFHYTESVEFCGKMCHKVMEPEYVAYQNSAHANVTCAECHVGPGADWYVKSKLSGLRQVIAVIKNDYPHPIPTPIRDLRPARVTCEQCHWPEKFYSHALVREKHFLTDDENTEWNIDLRMKIGASHSALGNSEGIHRHIHKDVIVQYWDQNEDRETLPYVRYVNLATGDTTIFVDEEAGIEIADVPLDELRTMDCMDCHNRPSHNYNVPQNFVDNGMASGAIPKTLPGIKAIAMDIFAQTYETREEADSTIEAGVYEYYADYYPELIETRKLHIDQAILGLKDGYSKNIFPEMKASWDAYPDQIGHMEYNGCFRCHNDRHSSSEGLVISKDCNLCHTILMQGPEGQGVAARFNESLEFEHPVDIGEDWKEMLCSDCHRYLY